MFVIEGTESAEPVEAMPGVERLTVDRLVAQAREAMALGIPAIAIFPSIDASLKDEDGTLALDGDNLVCRTVRAVKEACGDAHLKVILETGELKTYDNVRRACRVAMLGGADFIKTSTGKVSPASTRPVVLLMLEAVRDHFLETGEMVGVKAAGGIRAA